MTRPSVLYWPKLFSGDVVAGRRYANGVVESKGDGCGYAPGYGTYFGDGHSVGSGDGGGGGWGCGFGNARGGGALP